ncbi:MAG: hypothetical protein H3Z50_03735 [archaeon]|nr:hypothetical protein [archaeon]MCP8305826.1 hypothetical protein [archaeon]
MKRIPRELTDFFSEGNNIFLIKGDPGTGKTILSLEILRQFRKEKRGTYISTRVSPYRLLSQFPYLKDVVGQDKIGDYQELSSETFIVSDPRARNLPTIFEHFFELAMIIKNPLIVVDSWEVVTDRADPDEVKKSLDLIETLVSSKRANVVFVSETKEQTSLDYLVDGVVTLSSNEIEGRRIREMELKKLRGISIKQHRYLFTLEGGRFSYFPPSEPRFPEKPKIWRSLPDSETRLSSGIREFDKILGGGYLRGSMYLFEIGENVPEAGYGPIIRTTVCNFLANGNACSIYPSVDEDVEDIARGIIPFVGEDVFNNNVRIREFGHPSEKPYAFFIKSESVEVVFAEYLGVITELRGESNRPILHIYNIDMLELVYDIESLIKISSLVAIAFRKLQDVALIIVKPSTSAKFKDQIKEISKAHFKIVEKDGRLIIYGMKPSTGAYNLDVTVSKGHQRVKLTPIV